MTHQQKLHLISLCEAAHITGLETDARGLTVDYNELLDKKTYNT